MSNSILDTLMSAVDSKTLGAVAGKLGEPQEAVRSGLQGGAAAVLAAFANKASDSGFMGQALSLLKNPGNGSIASTVASLASGGAGDLGSKFLSLLFGSQQSSVAGAVASAAGLSSGSASSLLGMVGPLVMSVLGQKISADGLNAGSLGKLLGGEVSGLQKFLPAGLGTLLGGMGTHSHGGTTHSHAAEEPKAGNWWMWPLAIGALLLGGVWWYLNRGAEVKEVATDAAKTATDAAKSAVGGVSDMAKSAWAALGEFFKRKLPNGVEINVPKLGVENKLIDFIEDAGKAVDKTTWFDFDRLLFDTGSASLKAESQEQLGNIAAVLKAFPGVNLKIGGYTDNTGDKAANLKLSADRAKSVTAELVKLGVEATRLAPEGYGEEHPVADNTTEEGRAKNRRISMRVTKK